MFVFFELPDDGRHLVPVEVDRVPLPGERVVLTLAHGEVHTFAVERVTTAVIGGAETHRGVTVLQLRQLPESPHDAGWLKRLTPFPN